MKGGGDLQGVTSSDLALGMGRSCWKAGPGNQRGGPEGMVQRDENLRVTMRETPTRCVSCEERQRVLVSLHFPPF